MFLKKNDDKLEIILFLALNLKVRKKIEFMEIVY